MNRRFLPVTMQALALLGLCSLALAGDAKKAEDGATLNLAHIRLAGALDETPVAPDPLFGASGENFYSKLERIRKAKNDPSVQALLVQVDGINVGWAKIEELRAAIADFKKTGKKAYAFMEEGGAKDYLLASECDMICLPQSGWLMIVGIQAEVTFYKDLLEKLGIRADFLQMGVYKFAAEPYTRNKMSPEAKSQLKLVLDDFFDNALVGNISRSRLRAGRKDLTPEKISKLIDEGPFTATKALDLGLIDFMGYAEEFEKFIKNDLKAATIKVTRDYGKEKSQDIDFSNPFAIFKLFSPPKSAFRPGKDRIAVIYAIGPIMTGKSGQSLLGGSFVGSTTMVEAIRQAEKDPKVKAIVLRVDSPGGSALASDLIWNELKQCKKPVIASMSDVAASGGYYISMGARKIYAQPGTLTGSIGVVGGKLALGGLYDKIGITTEVIKRGENAGLLSSTEVFSKSQRKAMEAMMLDVYDQFLTKALAGRNQNGKNWTKKDLLKLAEGRIWTGRQALDNGLVDALGSLDDAIGEAKVMAGLARNADTDLLILPKPRTFLDALLEKGFDAQISPHLMPEFARLAKQADLAHHLHMAQSLLQLRQEPVWLIVPHGVQVR